MKSILKNSLSICLVALLVPALSAQEQKTEKGQIHLKISKEVNGKLSEIDTSFSIQDKAKIQEVLKAKGIDWSADESMQNAFKFKVDADGSNENKFIIKSHDGSSDSKNKFIHMVSKDGDSSEKEIEVLVMDVLGELEEEFSEGVHLDGNYKIIKLKSSDSNGDIESFLQSDAAKNLDEETRLKVEKALEELDHIRIEGHTIKGGAQQEMFFITDDKEEGNVKFEFKSDDGESKKVMIRTLILEEDEEGNVLKSVDQIEAKQVIMVVVDEESSQSESTKTEKVKQAEKLDNMDISKLQLYPNPSNGDFKIAFKSKINQDVQIDIRDTKGVSVYSKELKGFKGKFSEDIDLSDEQKGVYLFNLQVGDEMESRKIILN